MDKFEGRDHAISNKTLEGRKSIKDRWNSSRGANLVEMAMVLPLLLLLTFAIVDFSSLFYVYLALENGVSLATRYGVTGQQMNDPMNPTQLLSREDSVKVAMRQATPTLVIPDTAFTFEHLLTGVRPGWVGLEVPARFRG